MITITRNKIVSLNNLKYEPINILKNKPIIKERAILNINQPRKNPIINTINDINSDAIVPASRYENMMKTK